MANIEDVWELALEKVEQMGISEFDVSYYPILYLVLREKFDTPMKETMKKILNLADKLDYRHITKLKLGSSISTALNLGLLNIVDGNLPNLIRMEALVRNPINMNDFNKSLKTIRKELIER